MNSPVLEFKEPSVVVHVRKEKAAEVRSLVTPALPQKRKSTAPRGSAGRGVRAFQFFLFPLLVLTVWSIVSALRLLPANILPSPVAVIRTGWELITGEYGEKLSVHLVTSLWRVARGAAIGVPIGLALGLALGFSPTVDSWIGPLFRTIAQIPSIALIPLLMMVLGIDDRLKLFIMAKACVIPLTLVTADGIRNIPKTYLEVGRVLRLRRWTLLGKVVLPAALPSIFTGIRQGVAHVWVSLVAVEVLASSEGIGYLMTWGRLIFQLDVVLVCVGVIGLIGFILDFGLRRFEGHLLRWKGEAS
jgi:sulfonate transport system permease protein